MSGIIDYKIINIIFFIFLYFGDATFGEGVVQGLFLTVLRDYSCSELGSIWGIEGQT